MVRLHLLRGTILVVATLALTGCGAMSISRLYSSTAASSTATPSGSASPSTTTVALTPVKARFSAGEPISVTVRNGLPVTIYVLDNHSDCTPVQLETLASGGWQGLGACVNVQPHPHVLQIGAGKSLTIQLMPEQEANLNRGWPAGTYRAALTFATNVSQAIGQGQTVYSPPFDIG